jgi:asparagine synthase (glutamine-hydrolysing)
MCGIAGLFDTKGSRPFAAALVRGMTDAIAHRGPDGEGLHLEPGVALGHRRLAIIDLAGGAQPMRTPDGALTIVFNGEIYNFAELRAELQAKGACFRTRSDTEVLLHGWRRWGEALLPRLRGMFALALWDAREQTLVLARDPFGKKPLHYALTPDGTLAFGSEIKALLRLAEVSRELDPQAIEDFLTYGYVPDPKSIYLGIRKLAPGHVLVARRGRPIALRRYWSLLEALPSQAAPACEDALVERLGEAVRSRLVADVPLGALLSGGVDSSAVVAMMAGSAEGRLRAFSIAFGERGFDESDYARRVAAMYGADHAVRQVRADDFELMQRLPGIYDEPFGDVSALPTYAVCAQARRSVTVALSGDGGDEVLAGYRRYAFHCAGERLRARLPAAVRRKVLGPLGRAYPRAAWLPRPLRAKSTLNELSLDSAEAYARIVSALPAELRGALTTPEFRARLGGYDSAAVVRDAFQVDAPLDPLQRAQYADLTTYLPGDILTKVDRASMAHGLELRAPMLDVDFASWSFALPPRDKLNRAGGGKAILKRAMERYLPRDLLYRPKQGFTIPLAEWFRGPLRDQVRGLAESPALQDSGVLDLRRVRRLAAGHLGGLEDHSKALWLVWVLDAFLARRPAPGLQMR